MGARRPWYAFCVSALTRHRAAIDGYNKRQSFVSASLVSYDRHFLRSEFVTRLSVRGGPELARATTGLRHALFTGVQFASGESDAHFAEAHAATEYYYFGGQTPLAINFDVEFGGGASGVLRSAPVDKPVIASPGTRVVAGASSGRFNVAKDKTLQFEWTLPRGAYEDPKLSMAAEGLAMSAYGQLGDDDLSERSGFKLAIASYRGVQGSQNTSVRNFSVSTQMMPSTDTLRVALAVRTGAGEVVLDAGPYAWESFELACSLSGVQKAPVIKYSAEQLASRGVLREEGDALAFDIAARDGVYTVNGVRASELARM